MRIVFASTVLSALCLIAGCPTQQEPPAATVVARIGYSVSRGPAPLTVTFNAADSTSLNGGPLTYHWDFKDGTTSDEVAPVHTFQEPGRYVVELTVTDPLGEKGKATLEVRAAGSGATAVISASPTSGRAPLVVQFDGTQSSAPDDEILDYYWDFGDGSTSRSPQTWHSYQYGGEFLVTLKVVTAGGVEAEAEKTIVVGVPRAALRFEGAELATLPVTYDGLTAFTFEAWVKADSAGGTVAVLGAGVLALEVTPTNNTLNMRINGVTTSAAMAGLAGQWKHLAVIGTTTTNPGGSGTVSSCTLYLNGQPVATAAGISALTGTQITLGFGFQGEIAEVRFWGAARSTSELAANQNRRLAGTESNLLAYWRLDEGSGQALANQTGGAAGVRGLSASEESADPDWSTDGPLLD